MVHSLRPFKQWSYRSTYYNNNSFNLRPVIIINYVTVKAGNK